MAKNLNTYELAYECCNTVFIEDGRFPTIDSIRERIQINSPAVIKRAMNDWTLHFVEKHRERLEHPTMPTLLIDASESIWKLALLEADKVFAERNFELNLREAEWKSQIVELEKVIAGKESAWHAEKTIMVTELNSQTAYLSEMLENLKSTTTQLDESESNLSLTRQSLSRVEGALAEARTTHEAQTKEWSAKFEQDHDWHLKRIEEEKDSLRTQHTKATAELNRSLDSARMDQDSLRARLTQIMNQVGDSLERQSKLEIEMAQLRQSLGEMEKALQSEREKSGKLHALVKRQRRPAEQQLTTESA